MCDKHAAIGEIGYTDIHSQVQYSNRFDTTTAIVRRIEVGVQRSAIVRCADSLNRSVVI